jgi:NitT/TauT family transport system substrate-binding protein
MFGLSIPIAWSAATPTKITIPRPWEDLGSDRPSISAKDKGFFSQEGIDAQLVAMAPPTAIVALVAGELDFSTTLGAATSAMMRGSAIKRVFYIQHEPTFALTAQPEIKSIRELTDKVIGVNAPTDAMGMSAKLILKGNGIDPSRVTFLTTQVTENAYKALLSKRVAATCCRRPTLKRRKQKAIAAWRKPRTMLPSARLAL